MNQKRYDIIIVGGGMVGLTIACALAKQTDLSIAILESNPEAQAWQPEQYYPRVSAFALSSVRIFDAMGVWSSIRKKRASPFTHMSVWDDQSNAKVEFDGADIHEPVLGYIIENAAVQSSLLEKVKQHPQIDYIASVTLQQVTQHSDQIELIAKDGRAFVAKLAIAADGAHSWLRQQVGIGLDILPYEQKGVVTTVKTSLPHQRTARQVFLETGPLAFLPLSDECTSSIVWSLETKLADARLALTDDEFKQALAAAFSRKLGDIVEVEQRFAFPLQKQQAATYIGERIALAGDAAHTIHPMAGQGVNMGLLDAASLVEVLAGAYHHRKDFAGNHILRRYERWRRADNAGLLTGVDAIKNLFASEKKSIQGLRSCGLSLVESMPCIRNIFIRHAVGDRQDLPEMAK